MTVSEAQQQQLANLNVGVMWLTIVLMTILIVLLSITIYQVCRKMNFGFLIVLISLLLTSDVATVFLGIGLQLETVKSFHANHAMALAIEIGTTTFFFNAGTCAMHWLFALKYWIIAREVPKLFEGGHISFKETAYSVIKVVGLIINVVPCAILAIFRGQLTVQSAGGSAPPSKYTNRVQVFYHLVTGLQLVSAIVLADALRRIMSSLRQNPLLQVNEKIMWLHIVMLVLHTVVFSVSAFFVFRAFADPTNPAYLFEQSWSRIALFVSTFVVQIIMLYLFSQFFVQHKKSNELHTDQLGEQGASPLSQSARSRSPSFLIKNRSSSEQHGSQGMTSGSASEGGGVNFVQVQQQRFEKKRLQLILFIKNNMQATTNNDTNDLHDQSFSGLGTTENESATNLIYDRKRVNVNFSRKAQKKQKKKKSASRESESSFDSGLSDDEFLNRINDGWGREESELRQALYFQFIRAETFTAYSAMSRDEREDSNDIELDKHTLNSDQDFSVRGNSFRIDKNSDQSRLMESHHQALYDSQFTDSHFKINQTRTSKKQSVAQMTRNPSSLLRTDMSNRFENQHVNYDSTIERVPTANISHDHLTASVVSEQIPETDTLQAANEFETCNDSHGPDTNHFNIRVGSFKPDTFDHQ